MIIVDKFNPYFIHSFSNCSARITSKQLWDDLILNIAYCPVEYLNDYIDYESEYLKNNSCIDLSIVIFSGSIPIAIMPIYFVTLNLNLFKYIILPPLYCKSVSDKIVNESNKNIINFLFDYKRIHNLNFQFIFNFENSLYLNNFYLNLLILNPTVKVSYKLYLHLDSEVGIIRSNFRKSYKSLINNGIKLFNVCFLFKEDVNIWNKFKEFHFKVSGRRTRSDDSWDLQHKAIINGSAFLSYIQKEDSGELIGAAYFFYTEHEARYSVGVYNRDLSDLAISHTIQYSVIVKLKEMGIRFYCLGDSIYDDNEFSDKEIKISHFKKGFGAQTVCSHTINI